jgi:hypothetical protein
MTTSLPFANHARPRGEGAHGLGLTRASSFTNMRRRSWFERRRKSERLAPRFPSKTDTRIGIGDKRINDSSVRATVVCNGSESQVFTCVLNSHGGPVARFSMSTLLDRWPEASRGGPRREKEEAASAWAVRARGGRDSKARSITPHRFRRGRCVRNRNCERPARPVGEIEDWVSRGLRVRREAATAYINSQARARAPCDKAAERSEFRARIQSSATLARRIGPARRLLT